MKRTDTKTLISAMEILARDIVSEDGVANAAIREAADRMKEQTASIEQLQAIVDKFAKCDWCGEYQRKALCTRTMDHDGKPCIVCDFCATEDETCAT